MMMYEWLRMIILAGIVVMESWNIDYIFKIYIMFFCLILGKIIKRIIYLLSCVLICYNFIVLNVVSRKK